MSRYIDADALQLQLQKKKSGAANVRYTDGFNDALLRFKSMVHNAQTADVVPVVRGEWVLVGTNEHDYETSVEEKCSLCGRYVYRYDTQPQDNYCPNCGSYNGADMRRESETKE